MALELDGEKKKKSRRGRSKGEAVVTRVSSSGLLSDERAWDGAERLLEPGTFAAVWGPRRSRELPQPRGLARAAVMTRRVFLLQSEHQLASRFSSYSTQFPMIRRSAWGWLWRLSSIGPLDNEMKPVTSRSA